MVAATDRSTLTMKGVSYRRAIKAGSMALPSASFGEGLRWRYRLCGWRLSGWDFADGPVLVHFVQPFLPDAFDGEEIVDALVPAIGLPQLQDLVGCRWANSGNTLQFGGTGAFRFTG